MKHNLEPKCITDFKKGDSIYISLKGKNNDETFLCEFKEIKYNKIIGVVIESTINKKDSFNKGNEIQATLTSCSLYGKNPVSGRSYFHWFMSSGYAIYPSQYNLENDNADIIKEHPSFGRISLSRTHSSGGRNLFGSSIQHKETIRLSISTADVNRELNREWYHSKKELIEIEMSISQFAEFITTPNTTGVCCTIKHIDRQMIPEPPYESKGDLFSKEFENKIKNIMSGTKDNLGVLETILAKKSINKSDKEEIKSLFTSLINPIKSSIPFIEKSFKEQMEQTIVEAKSEVESFINRRLTEEGRKALTGEGGEIKLINENNTKNTN